ncbi:MAG: MFS transporter [Oscillospiraceae bacterium]|nr:MFS transporter [Oscillospiraceae bacterium]
MNEAPVTGKLWNRTMVLTILVSVLYGLSYAMLNPALPIYVESLGYGTDIVGTIVGVATFFAMIFRGLAGGWSDRLSRKTIILTAFLTSAAAFLLFCVARSLPLLYLARCLQGVSSGIVVTVLCTIAYDSLPPEMLGMGVAVYALSEALIQSIAPSIGTALAVRGHHILLFLLAAVSIGLAFVILLLIPVPLTAKAKAWQEAKKNGTADRRGFHLSDYLCRPALPAAFLLLMMGIIYAAVSNYLSICGVSRGISQVALFFTINAIVLMATRILWGRISDRKHLGWLLIPGFLFLGIACVLIAQARSITPIIIAAVFHGFGYSATMSGTQLWAIRSVGQDQRSTANSTYYVGGDLGLALGAYLSGALAAHVNYTAMYLVIAGICVFSALWFVGFMGIKGSRSQGLVPPDWTNLPK